jgi:transposase
MLIVPKAFPPEFRRDVVAVSRKGQAPLSQIAKDSESPSRSSQSE